MKTAFGAAIVAALLVGPLTVRAEVIQLTYIGQPTRDGGIYGITDAEGSGVLVIPDNETTVTGSDVISFSFTLTVNGVDGNNNPITDTDTFTLSDLNAGAFSASFDAGGNVLDMSLATDTGTGDYWFPGQSLNFVLAGDSSTGNSDVGTMTIGTFTAVPTPEPASLALLGTGLTALGLRRRKR